MLIQFFRLFLSIIPLVIIFPASAVMQPQTSMVLIQEDAGGGSINVTNTDDKDALLYVKVIDL
ncbi:fimbrial chaperone protein, partial [Erwinia sp. MYb416]